MEAKEKSEFVELIKNEMKAVAKAEAEGQSKAHIEELNKGLEAKIQKSLEGIVTKEEFDKMEGTLSKKLNDFEAGKAKNVTFTEEVIKGLEANKDALSNLMKGAGGNVKMDIRKDPGNFTSANSLGVTNATQQFAVNNNMEIVPIARRQRHVREVLGMGTSDDSVYPFLRETPKEGSFGVQNPEGAKKSQIEYKATLVNATESTIAAWQKIGRQTLRNVRGIATFINVTMVNDLLLKEDNDLLFGTGLNSQVLGIFDDPINALQFGTIPSFKTVNPTLYDCIAGFAALLANREYIASFAMVHPVDYWQMVIEKDNDARYQQNIIFDAATSMLYVFGIPVIATTAIPVGNIGVGDGRYVMPLQREGISLRFFEQDDTNVQDNLVTARIEESILNVVRRSDAFAYDTIAEIKGSIDIPTT